MQFLAVLVGPFKHLPAQVFTVILLFSERVHDSGVGKRVARAVVARGLFFDISSGVLFDEWRQHLFVGASPLSVLDRWVREGPYHSRLQGDVLGSSGKRCP